MRTRYDRRTDRRIRGTGSGPFRMRGAGLSRALCILLAVLLTGWAAAEEESGDTAMLRMKIGDTEVRVEWEDNEAAEALAALAQEGPVEIRMSMYGGFEQVGPIGRSLPRSDEQITAQAGDIVLYSGDRLVVFYGSNSWAYTRLGHIADRTADELRELLGSGDVTVTIGG